MLDIADSSERSAAQENCTGVAVAAGAVPVKSARLVLAAILLFLVVAVDFTGQLMSVLADGVLVAAVLAVLWPLLRKSE